MPCTWQSGQVAAKCSDLVRNVLNRTFRAMSLQTATKELKWGYSTTQGAQSAKTLKRAKRSDWTISGQPSTSLASSQKSGDWRQMRSNGSIWTFRDTTGRMCSIHTKPQSAGHLVTNGTFQQKTTQ